MTYHVQYEEPQLWRGQWWVTRHTPAGYGSWIQTELGPFDTEEEAQEAIDDDREPDHD